MASTWTNEAASVSADAARRKEGGRGEEGESGRVGRGEGDGEVMGREVVGSRGRRGR